MGRRGLLLILCAASLVVGASGCGGSSGDSTASREQSQTSADLTKSSGIEGIPLPADATPLPGFDGGWNVPGSDYDTVVAFYEDRIPEGKDWRDWKWCDTGGGDTIHAHIYAKGRRDILNVTVADDNPPGVIIGTDESGPC